MNITEKQIENYLTFCKSQKCLDIKTIHAYKNDLIQFCNFVNPHTFIDISINSLEKYIAFLHDIYKPKTAKRKIASIKAFFHYLEYKDIISLNPFNKLQYKFREPITLPKTIPLSLIEHFLKTIYEQHRTAKTTCQQRNSLRDVAVIELLFSTGIRISELCSLKYSDVNLIDNSILIFGKGAKERIIQIGNEDVLQILKKYQEEFKNQISKSGYFFVKSNGEKISDQSIRRMINKYCKLAQIDIHITPHMFRHTFATSLLESDVDIRYIQKMLGHSSISITEIYTHVSMSKQKDILQNRHPRKDFRL